MFQLVLEPQASARLRALEINKLESHDVRHELLLLRIGSLAVISQSLLKRLRIVSDSLSGSISLSLSWNH